MLRPGKFALILGIAGAMAALPSLTLAQTSQKDSEAAGVAAAIRFQRAEDAAAARQAARGGESNSADRMAPQTTAKVAPKESQAGGVAAAIRFQQAEQVAADRQARIEAASRAGESSADRMAPEPKSRTKTARTTSAPARSRDSQ